MSAEVLRRAAAEMHLDAGIMERSDHIFLHAVADMLEAEALAMEFDIGVGLSEREAASGAGVHALTVARAYLGESA